MAQKTKYDVGFMAKNSKGLEFVVLERHEDKKVKIKFISSGYEKIISSDAIRKGNIKDRLNPSFSGVGYIGVGPYGCEKHKHILHRWAAMIKRCYCKKSKSYPFYGAKGVTVCNEWLNFQNYCRWYVENVTDDSMRVDKDFLSNGCKIYSPATCSVVSHQRNSEISVAKGYSFISPSGEEVEIFNLRKFCRENNLIQSSMSSIVHGGMKNHRGWTIGRRTDNELNGVKG